MLEPSRIQYRGDFMSLDPQIIECLHKGQGLFNKGKFFEAHEIWEETWVDTEGDERHLLQGLIQVAAGFYKLQVGMPTGTYKLLEKGAGHLRAIPTNMYGVDLPNLLDVSIQKTGFETMQKTRPRGVIRRQFALRFAD